MCLHRFSIQLNEFEAKNVLGKTLRGNFLPGNFTSGFMLREKIKIQNLVFAVGNPIWLSIV
jgi:hypothetical protein